MRRRSSADLLLLVLDGSEPLTPLDATVATELQSSESEYVRPAILVLNKADLPRQLSEEAAQALWPDAPLVATSTVTGNGLAALEGQIAALALGGTARQAMRSSPARATRMRCAVV